MPSNNNEPKWKRGSNLQLNFSEKGTRRSRTPLRRRAGLPPLPSPKSYNTRVYSANWRSGNNKYQVFFPVNKAPNFMERKPTMKKMMNRLRSVPKGTRRVARNNLFEPKPKGTRRRSPSSSPNMFANVLHLFKNKGKK
jgi:hypothetical protein